MVKAFEKGKEGGRRKDLGRLSTVPTINRAGYPHFIHLDSC